MKIPYFRIPKSATTEHLKPLLDAVTITYKTKARKDLDSFTATNLEYFEQDHERSLALRQEWIATPKDATKSETAENKKRIKLQKDIREIDERIAQYVDASIRNFQAQLQTGANHLEPRLVVYRADDGLNTELRWSNANVDPVLNNFGCTGINYSLVHHLDENSYSIGARTKGEPGGNSACYLNIDLQEKRIRMTFGPGQNEQYRHISIGGKTKLKERFSKRPLLDGLTEFQERFAAQALNDIGVGWPLMMSLDGKA